MSQANPIQELIDRWPTRRDFAAAAGVSVDRVHKWASSGRIPARYLAIVRDAAREFGLGITADWLVDVHADGGRDGGLASVAAEDAA